MKKLQWDSNYWGIDIYDTNLSFNDFKLYSAENPYLIQTLINLNDTENIRRAEKYGFNFIESKITLEKKKLNNNGVINCETSNFRILKLEEIKDYEIVFYELFGSNTRFSMFSKEKIKKFYYLWIENSIKGIMDDQCIGYFLEGKLAGFITYKVRGTGLIIGLLGVFPEYQGKSIAKKLLEYVELNVVTKEIDSITIATQGTNLNAINAYIKSGFKVQKIENWYYFMNGVKYN